MLQRLMLLVLAGILCVLGCREGKEPEPQFNASMEASGKTLVPAHVPDYSYSDKSILAAAAREEEVPAKPKPETKPAEVTFGEPAALEIDDSSPEAILETFQKLSEDQNLNLLVDIVVPEQQDLVREMAEAMEPMLDAMKELQEAFKKAFPDEQLQGMQTPGGMIPGAQGKLEIANIEEISETEYEATLNAEGMPQPVKFTCRKIEDAWRIELPGMPGPEQLEMARQQMTAIPKIADAVRELADRVVNDEFDSPEKVGHALMQTIMQAAAGAGAGPGQ